MPSLTENFIHLRTSTAYSLLEGAIKISKLIKLAKEAGMPAIAITDRDNLFGSMEFSQEAVKNGIQPIIGCKVTLGLMFPESGNARITDEQLLLLAKDDTGYANLMRLASKAYLQPEGGDGPKLSYDFLSECSEGLIALTAGTYGAVGQALSCGNMDRTSEALNRLKTIFGDRLYIELMRHGLLQERQIEHGLIELAYEKEIPLVATNDIYFAGGREEYEAHDALLCIADGRYVVEENRRRLTPEHRFKTTQEMRVLFADLPEAIDNTLVIAERCAVMSAKRKPILPRYTEIGNAVASKSEADTLREKAAQGLEKRLEKTVYKPEMTPDEREAVAKPYRDRLQFELDVIIQMEYPGYFLIVSDFIIWAKEQGIPVGPGRGSGAASVVAWSLLITDLDPLKYDLVFERFLNPERVSMPDFDIDFCQDRRDEVIRYVQERYGNDRVAQIITFGKLQARAVLRDVGRVLQLPYGQVDRICKMVPNNPAAPVTLEEAINMEPMLRRAIEEDETVERMVTISLKLEGLYRHASTHAAGVVIADRPLEELVALYRDPRSDMPVIQYSMKYAEDAGLVKFDFLGLKTLTVIQTAVQLIRQRGIEIDIDNLPLDDKPTYELLTRGDTIGIFQFESAGMRDSLRKLKPDCLEDLIALGALYRPGPMDNIPLFINRKHGREEVDYMHPRLEPVLKETYGVIIYQEQVQKIAQILAGYTLGGADLLRRAMGKKIKEEMDAQRAKFVEGAKANSVEGSQASFIFDLVAKFAGYGFNKAHAAAYALIGYQTAYLKANYPVEFLAASMTFDMHNTDKLSIFREDAIRSGIELLPPDINRSMPQFSVETHEEKLAIRYALGALKGVGIQAMRALTEERNNNGAFPDVFDLFQRIDPRQLNRRQLESLIKAGAFDELNPNRCALFESIDVLMAYSNNAADERASNQINLFGEAGKQQTLPALVKCPDWTPLERLEQEFAAVGFYLSSHPLEGYRGALKRMNITLSSRFGDRLGGEYSKISLAGIVTGSKFKVSDRGRFAFIQLSDPTGVFEVSIFNETLLTTCRPLLENGSLLLINAEGKMEEAGPRLIANDIRPLQEAAQHSLSKQLDIHLESAEPVKRIRELIGIPMNKGTHLVLHVPVSESREAKIKLAEPYQVPPDIILILRSLPGVKAISEN